MTVTVRLDPRLRYLAELAARKHRRTLSSFIEWALEDALGRVMLEDNKSIADAANRLWDVDEADRFAMLAFNYPDLLTHDEQVLWKLIVENGWLWRGQYNDSSCRWEWATPPSSLIYERLREHWELFKAVACGDKDKEELPSWDKVDPDPIPF
jgi:hypothetical protein